MSRQGQTSSLIWLGQQREAYMSKLDEVADQPILEGTADIYQATGACVGLAIALHGALCELHNLGHEELFEKIRNAAKIDAAKSTTELRF
jgi:hypothetical protein